MTQENCYEQYTCHLQKYIGKKRKELEASYSLNVIVMKRE